MKLNWTNQLENRILIIGTAVVMIVDFIVFQNVFVRPVYEAQIESLRKQVEINNTLIKELAKEPKYAIQNDFEKIKAQKGQVVLDLNNKLDATELRIPETVIQDTTITKPKTFWDKLFRRK